MKNLIAICTLLVAFGFMSDLNAQQAQKQKYHKYVVNDGPYKPATTNQTQVEKEPAIEICKFANADQAREALPQLQTDLAKAKGELMAAQKQFYTTENEVEKAKLKVKIDEMAVVIKRVNAELDAANTLAKSEPITAPSRN